MRFSLPEKSYQRKFFKVHVWEDFYTGTQETRKETQDITEADVVSSEMVVPGNWHAPLLDLDYHASLIPSGTSGHFHLYLDKAVEWKDYKRVLKALARAGLIEQGYMRASLRRRATHLRVPWKPKRIDAPVEVKDPWAVVSEDGGPAL